MIDSTIVRAHQHSAGARKKRAARKPSGAAKGLSTKIHAAVDALGNPIGFHLTGGQACDLEGADALLPQIKANTLLADKGFDAGKRVLEPLAKQASSPLSLPNAIANSSAKYDKELYKAQHLIEKFFAKLKLYRSITTRYDKTSRNFLAVIHLAATTIWLIDDTPKAT